jgi:hypothetical protein
MGVRRHCSPTDGSYFAITLLQKDFAADRNQLDKARAILAEFAVDAQAQVSCFVIDFDHRYPLLNTF